ncbi:SGNH/GDSL hydrolase family protein [Cohnella abietis]|uniref:Acyl-CoA thioesterase n=1 Tax=Cohnella abietis TaxID=2507935 RepID=A0A3T1D3N7_9BACL|nr:SGNH/GDSL hydrolase family protein [Cohnella abietis]BBI32661.1 acyl-CoA thioesterase [Cohnella abietis]
MFHNREGLPRLREKLQSKEPAIVAFLGGSITEGYGASEPDKTSWRALTETYFTSEYPEVRWTFVNAGVGGTNSSLGAHRLRSHTPLEEGIDLLLVEFAVNDSQHRARSEEGRAETIRGMEGILRQCRTLSPSADIAFLYSANEDNLAEAEPFFIAVHEEVAEHYGIPSVSFMRHARDWLDAGKGKWEEFAPDGVHPSDAGYALYAEALRGFLEHALGGSEETGRRVGSRELVLPAPLREDNYELADMLKATSLYDVQSMSWSDRPEPLVNWRYDAKHLASEEAGAEFSFEVYGRGAGLLLLCGLDTGIFEFSVNGEEYREYNPFDEWCLLFNRPVMALLASREQEVTLRIQVRNTTRKDERSIGNKLRVLRILRH